MNHSPKFIGLVPAAPVGDVSSVARCLEDDNDVDDDDVDDVNDDVNDDDDDDDASCRRADCPNKLLELPTTTTTTTIPAQTFYRTSELEKRYNSSKLSSRKR